jgi:putative membrane protein
MPDSLEQDPRVYFAAERTFLAWIRTGIALMGFGFAIARFGIFLREMQPGQSGHPRWTSPVTGVLLLALGVAVNVLASLQYAATIRQLREGSWIPGRLSKTALTLALLLAALGIIMGTLLLLMQ